jgi:thiamine-phosphate pyrophosphorylase
MVAAALAAGDVASLLVSAGAQQMEMTELLMPLTRARQTALLLDGVSAAARKGGADGVHLPADESAYRAARSVLGEDAIIGVDCGSSRHLAMAFGEMGADYVGFSGLAPASPGSIIAWWAELFEVPCVALDPADESAARILVADGADFIRPPDDMWASADAAARTVDSYNALIGEIFR